MQNTRIALLNELAKFKFRMELQRMRDTNEPIVKHEEIERRAYEIYLQRGGGHGRDLDDWFAAEQELAHERRQDNESIRSSIQEQQQPAVRRLVRSDAAGAR
jgi:hypothetical protein